MALPPEAGGVRRVGLPMSMRSPTGKASILSVVASKLTLLAHR